MVRSRIESSGFVNIVIAPTWVSCTSSSMIDIFNTVVDKNKIQVGVVILDISYHVSIFVSAETELKP